MKVFLLLLCLFINNCENQFANLKLDSSVIEGRKGLVVLADGYNKPNDFLRFYNEDGSFWYEFTFYYDDSDGKFEYENSEFRPYAFHPDYFLLALKYVDEDASRFKVVVNEEKGLVKYVNKADKNLQFQTWEAHIFKAFSIEFDEKENPLREMPDGKIKKFDYSKHQIFSPVEIQGEWLKVDWKTESDLDKNQLKTDFGWIRWKQNEKLLINLFYFA